MTNLENLSDKFRKSTDLIIDAGETNVGIASTIIKIESEEIQILRQGPISKLELES